MYNPFQLEVQVCLRLEGKIDYMLILKKFTKGEVLRFNCDTGASKRVLTYSISMSTIVLTPEIRELSYFSAFSQDEEIVTIPRPMINESINYKNIYNLEEISLQDLLTIIDNRIYLNLNNDELVKELLWRLGETQEKMNSIKTLSNSIQVELDQYLKQDESEYIYGIRCKILTDTPNVKKFTKGEVSQLERSRVKRDTGAFKNEEPCHLVAEHGNLRLLKWLHSKGYCWDETTFCSAIEKSTEAFDVVKYLHENGCPWSRRVSETAAFHGRLDILKYLHENSCPWDTGSFYYAVQRNHIDVVKYLFENDRPRSKDICAVAAEHGHLELLKYLHNNGFPWTHETFMMGVRSGSIDILEYLYKNGCPYDSSVYYHAYKSIKAVEWLYKKGMPWDEYACLNAAYNGCLDIIKYFHNNGYPWNESLCEGAAYSNSLDILKYFHENGCPWDESTCIVAARDGYLNILKYACENGCPYSIQELYDVANHYKRLDIVEYLDSLQSNI